ncbi:MAG: alpha/beta hydrolase [Desulfobacterales bacterium]|jgi:pimeloyl-ACP methyl ester carboxylesterase|nr:alpha/beta hydrolase [Desulfobacterales bacterium]
MKLYVERHGKGKKLLFIHGAGGSSASFHLQKQYLKHCVEVILIDLPGRGKSGDEGCRSIPEYVEVVRTVIDEQGLEGCYLVGHSMGGLIAMSLAIAHPKAIKGLVLITTGARLRVSPAILEWIMVDKERTVKSLALMGFSKKTPPAVSRDAVAEMMKVSEETMYGDFLACDQADIMEEVGRIKMPTLIIRGSDDQLTPPHYSEHLNHAIKGSEMVSIADAGHWVLLEKAEEVNRAIERFITHQ